MKKMIQFQNFFKYEIKYTVSEPGRDMSDSKGCKLREQKKMSPETKNLLCCPSSRSFFYSPFLSFLLPSYLQEDQLLKKLKFSWLMQRTWLKGCWLLCGKGGWRGLQAGGCG